MNRPERWRGRTLPLALSLCVLAACDRGAPPSTTGANATKTARLAALSDSAFGALVARISEPGGYFDTDNLISNERGYLKVMGALDRLGLEGGAFVGVGPDQSYSYISQIRPEVAFITDIRRDNLLEHLLLKALVERAPTRVEFLSDLFGRRAPPRPDEWVSRSADQTVAWVDGHAADSARIASLRDEVDDAVSAMGIPLSAEDRATIARFHGEFIRGGMGLRFTSFGRPPRSYYPTYRQLVLETDLDGEPSSWLASAAAYETVRRLHLANRIVPVVGDLAGPRALREIGRVMEEMGVTLTAFYTSNVEFYLAAGGRLEDWLGNLAGLPAAPGAVVIRSYFPTFGGPHPSAVPGYRATQTLQPVSVATGGGFTSYWDLVTRRVIDLR
jgi:hypothetical protein